MHLIKANSEEALEMLRATTSDPMIHKAIDAVYALNADAELREKIRQRDKAVRDYANDMAVAEDNGKAKKAVETAVNLIQNGKLSFEEIAGVTGLPLDDSCSMKSSSLQESSTCHCDRCFSHEQRKIQANIMILSPFFPMKNACLCDGRFSYRGSAAFLRLFLPKK